MPLKVYVDTGDWNSMWSTNGLEFDSYEAAKVYGEDLFSRWTMVRQFAVIPVQAGFAGSLTEAAIRAVEVRE